jgi:hypothetical protein
MQAATAAAGEKVLEAQFDQMLQAFTALLHPTEPKPRVTKQSKQSKRHFHSSPLLATTHQPQIDTLDTQTMDTIPAADQPPVFLKHPIDVDSSMTHIQLENTFTPRHGQNALTDADSSHQSESDSYTSFTGSSHSTGYTNETFNVYDAAGVRLPAHADRPALNSR